MSTQIIDNIVDIPDEEIRRRLINDFNIECGPVTPQTKRILLKKLIKLEQERNANSSNVSINETNGTFDNGSLNNNIDEEQPEQQRQHSRITNGNDGGGRSGEISNGRGDEISAIQIKSPRGEIRTILTARRQSPRKYSPRKQQTINEEQEAIKSFKEVEKTLKQPVQKLESVKKSIKTPKNDFHVTTESSIRLNEYSCESSDDSEDSITTSDLLIFPSNTSNTLNPYKISGVTMPRVSSEIQTYRPISSLTRAPIRRSGTTSLLDSSNKKSVSSLLNYSDSESELEHSYKKDKICQMLLNHRPGLGRGKQNCNKSSFMSRFTSFFQNFKRKSSSRKESATNFSTSSNYISLALLIFVVIFFIVIFSIYFYSKFTYTSRYSLDLTDYAFIEDKSKLLAPICSKDILSDCLQSESDKKPSLNIIKEIKSIIDKRIYESYCKSPGVPPEITSFVFKRSDLEKEIKSNLSPGPVTTEATSRGPSLEQMNSFKLFSHDLSNALKLIKLNSAWNIKVEDPFQSELSLMPNYIINLPFQCRLKLFWRSNFWMIISTIIVLVFSAIFFFYYRYSKHLEVQEQELVYDLIEKSMELLQSPDEPQSMPVLHIRDTLLSPAEKKSTKYKRIWNKVVNHIENSDSRVKVEYKKIDGEEFKAWKWIATTNSQYITDSENDGDYLTSGSSQTQKIGGVEWQGQAFVFSNNKTNASLNNESIEHSFQPDINRNKNFQALTRFLKIRNIFEKEAQYVDSNWSTKIKNTILEKTAKTSENGQHDIVHIEIDDSTNEGLVFLKCGSMTGATNAFHALHGWWCEKKLVSVKFLKEERYYQRFPQSRHMDTPLEIKSID